MSELEQQSLGVRVALSRGSETELSSQWKHEATLGLLYSPFPHHSQAQILQKFTSHLKETQQKHVFECFDSKWTNSH